MLFDPRPVDPSAPKATRIDLFSISTPQMKAFHITWMAFFVCFFAWFAAAPLMPLIKNEFGLSKDQIANINIAAVAVTILVRLIIGPLCDKFGPRRTYTWLLFIGALPVLGLSLREKLRGVPVLPPADRRDRRVVRHHAVPHERDVRAERRRYRERRGRRLGQRRRRRHAVGDAADRRGRREPRRRAGLRLARRDAGAGHRDVIMGFV